MLAAALLAAQIPKGPPPVQTAKAQLVLTAERTSVAPREDPGYRLVIRNVGRVPLNLVEPQDGSEIGLRNPGVGWILPDLKARTPVFRCGNVNELQESAFFTLRPGESREISAGWAGAAELKPGANRVSFAYDIEPARKDKGFAFAVVEPSTPGASEFAERKARVEALYAALTPVKLVSNVVRVIQQPTP